MIIEFGLKNFAARLAIPALAVIACAGLVVLIMSRFAIGTLADDRFSFARSSLLYPVK
jgi:hypothetical protein